MTSDSAQQLSIFVNGIVRALANCEPCSLSLLELESAAGPGWDGEPVGATQLRVDTMLGQDLFIFMKRPEVRARLLIESTCVLIRGMLRRFAQCGSADGAFERLLEQVTATNGDAEEMLHVLSKGLAFVHGLLAIERDAPHAEFTITRKLFRDMEKEAAALLVGVGRALTGLSLRGYMATAEYCALVQLLLDTQMRLPVAVKIDVLASTLEAMSLAMSLVSKDDLRAFPAPVFTSKWLSIYRKHLPAAALELEKRVHETAGPAAPPPLLATIVKRLGMAWSMDDDVRVVNVDTATLQSSIILTVGPLVGPCITAKLVSSNAPVMMDDALVRDLYEPLRDLYNVGAVIMEKIKTGRVGVLPVVRPSELRTPELPSRRSTRVF